MSRSAGRTQNGRWREVLLGGIASAFVLELSWESAQMPWYAGWGLIPWQRLAFYIALGTAGDLLTLALAYTVTALLCRDPWFFRHNVFGWIVFTLLGLTYTMASEYVNVYIWHRWAYSQAMPTLPLVGTGLCPFLQWLVLPPAWLALLRWHDARLARTHLVRE